MPLYRVFCELEDGYGGKTMTRIGHTYTVMHKCIEAAIRASVRYGVAEIKDDSLRMSERLIAVFRNGKSVGYLK